MTSNVTKQLNSDWGSRSANVSHFGSFSPASDTGSDPSFPWRRVWIWARLKLQLKMAEPATACSLSAPVQMGNALCIFLLPRQPLQTRYHDLPSNQIQCFPFIPDMNNSGGHTSTNLITAELIFHFARFDKCLAYLVSPEFNFPVNFWRNNLVGCC